MKTKILLLLAVVTFLTACETNDNANIDITSADLIGTWNLTQQSIDDGSMTITSEGQTQTVTYSALAKDLDITYTFSVNPNELNLNGSYTLVATANFLGQSETEEQEINTSLFPIKPVAWSLNGNALTFTEENDFPAVLNVVEFSENYLKLVGEINETETDGGESYNIKATITFVLEK
ncbi:MAG: lipocalin family protein [Polaribacter sp.]|uniref:lipocalin family protein n=1 Tax=Polaribacter sp. TaxID=1920175 RepID=UPI003263D058